jgi:dTDP-4-dehydrorhamnose 3,5-epimerase
MQVHPTSLPGLLLIESRVFRDARGFFAETWQAERYREIGLDLPFVQDNASRSEQGVLRGLHAQFPHAQGKLVGVLDGEVYDVAVDIRSGSPTFGQWFGATLSADNGRQMWIPPGFAHGFAVTSASALFVYKCTAPYVPEAELAVRWDDPEIGISWPIPAPILSPKDAAAPLLRDLPRERLYPYPAG